MSKIEENENKTKIIKKIAWGIAKKILVITLPIMFVLILLAGFLWYILDDNGVWKEDEKGKPSTYTSSAKLDLEKGIVVDSYEIIKTALADLGYTEEEINELLADETKIIEMFDFSKKLNRKIQSISDCTQAEILWCLSDVYSQHLKSPEELEYLLNAELVTQFPKLGIVEEGRIDGRVQFQRAINNNGQVQYKTLNYIKEADFNQKVEEYRSNGTGDVFEYFTIDENMNVIVAISTTETGNFLSNNTTKQGDRRKVSDGYNINSIQSNFDARFNEVSNSENEIEAEYTQTNISTTTISYKQLINQYTLPFEYLWSLLVVGQSYDFVKNLADLAYNSEINIGIYKNISVVTSIETKTYKEQFGDLLLTDEDADIETVESHTYEDVLKITTTYNSVQVDIASAKTWIVDVVSEYNYVISEPTKTDFEPVKNIESRWRRQSEYDTESTKAYYRIPINTVQNSQEEMYKKFEKVKTTVTEKTDINPDTDQNFVKLLRADAKAFPILIDKSAMIWLSGILEKNQDTANMVDLTMYLINKARNPDATDLSFDFSIYNPDNFTTISGVNSNLLKEYIHYWEHSDPPPTNADGTKYIIESDGAGHPTVGYGVDIENCGYKYLFVQAGYPTTIGGEVDKEFVDSIEEKEIEDKTRAVKALTAGLNLTEYQLNALISRAYNCGTAGAITQKRGNPQLGFVDSYNKYWNSSTDDKFEKKDKNADFSHSLYKQYMSEPITSDGNYMLGLERRRKSEWVLFQTGYYDVLNTWHVSGGAIIEVAEKIHAYMEENNYSYCVYGSNSYEECSQYNKSHALAVTFEKSKSSKTTCCATFVSWVLQESGYLTDAEHTDGADELRNLLINKGWQKINLSDLQAGDVLCYSGHIEIYAGDGTVYNAGSGNAIRNPAPAKRSISSALYGLRPN